jgi:hypothetical protein
MRRVVAVLVLARAVGSTGPASASTASQARKAVARKLTKVYGAA